MAMFKYACFKRGLDFKAIKAIDAGSTEKMIAAFRKGEGDFIHLQGPAPQQLAARQGRDTSSPRSAMRSAPARSQAWLPRATG